MRRLERGASYVPLIIVAVLLVVAGVWAFIQTDKADKLERDIANFKAQAQEQNARRTATLGYLQKLGDRIGFGIETPTEDMKAEYRADTSKVNEFIAEKLAYLKDKYTRDFPVSVYSFDENGGVKRSEPEEGKVKVGYISVGKIPAETTLQNLFGLMDEGLGRMLNDITRLVAEKKQLQEGFDQREAEFRTTLTTKDQEIGRLRSEVDNLTAQKAQLEREKNDEIQGLENQKREAVERADSLETQMKEQVADLNNQILARDQDIQKLKRRKLEIEVPVGPDGQVLAVTDDQGIAVINRGKKDHLAPNTSFTFYTLGKGAQKIEKGTGVVLDVESDQARVRITSLANAANPIVPGDYFESVTYNPSETLHFYLLGRMQKYGRSDAAQRLQQLGQAVDDKVGISTDYLVLGSPEGEDENLRDTEAYKRAQELGIKVITERQLSQFLNY
jgi:type II secretory pathway pseudopilin PulG